MGGTIENDIEKIRQAIVEERHWKEMNELIISERKECLKIVLRFFGLRKLSKECKNKLKNAILNR